MQKELKKNNKLELAILTIYSGVKNPRSSDWFIYIKKRNDLICQIKRSYLNIFNDRCLISEEEILKAWDVFGKNKNKNIKRYCKDS